MKRNQPADAGEPPRGSDRRYAPPPARGNVRAAFTCASYDAETHSVDAVLTTSTPVNRGWMVEILDCSGDAVDLSRAALGQIRLLDTHDASSIDSILGTVTNIKAEGDKVTGTFTFAQTDRARAAEAMVSRGEVTGVSIGYQVRQWTATARDEENDITTWTATSWELLEASLVPVPADASAGMRSVDTAASAPGKTAISDKDDPMKRSAEGGSAPVAAPQTNPAAPVAALTAAPAGAPARAAPVALPKFSATEALAFVEQARTLGVDKRAAELIALNEKGEVGIDAARIALLTAAAERQAAAVESIAPGGASRVVTDESDKTRNAVEEALVARLLQRSGTVKVPEVSAHAREFMDFSLLEMARSRTSLSPRERNMDVIMRAANTTSDFGYLLESALNKVLLTTYEIAVPQYRRIAQRRDFNDFRPHNFYREGNFPALELTTEDGEIKAGAINTSKESVSMLSYAKIFRVTRQALQNDDLDAIMSMIAKINNAVIIAEQRAFFAMKSANSGLGPVLLTDGKKVFDTAHNNVAATPSVIDIPNTALGRATILKQTDLDGNPLNIIPTILWVGPDQQTAAEQLVYPINPNQESSVNPFSNKLEVVTDAYIGSGKTWELYVDPSLAPVWIYGYNKDAPGPRVTMDQPFNTDGWAWRAILDFGCGAVGSVGSYRNAGA